VLKQRVRDCIDPGRDLGHSDKGRKKKVEGKVGEVGKTEEVPKEEGEKVLDGKGEEEEVLVEEEVDENDKGVELKRNPDGTVCEDCA
jgi:hypothetical protein